jgi:hypothetical protein
VTPNHFWADLVFASDKPCTVRIAVRNDRVTITIDGKSVVEWKADYNRASMRAAWTVRESKSLFLGSNKCVYRVTKWDLIPTGSRKVLAILAAHLGDRAVRPAHEEATAILQGVRRRSFQ